MDEALLRKFHKELSAGTVSLALLAVVGASEEPMYGYHIPKRLEQRGGGGPGGRLVRARGQGPPAPLLPRHRRRP